MLARARYLNRVAAAYLGSGPSQLTFWHGQAPVPVAVPALGASSAPFWGRG